MYVCMFRGPQGRLALPTELPSLNKSNYLLTYLLSYVLTYQSSIQRIVAFVAQTECFVRVLEQNKFDSSIDSVKYAMILSIDKRKPDLKVSDQVRHKPGSATTCGWRLQFVLQESDFTNCVAKKKALIR